MNNLENIVGTARTLLASGVLGAELWQRLGEVYPHLTPKTKKRVAGAIKKEVGILGQVAHDPNIYPNCRVASTEKQKNPNQELMIATYRTPMCGTCQLRRGSTCGLMGGKLIASPEDMSEKNVQEVAENLVASKKIDKERAESIVAARKLSPSTRVASLSLSRMVPKNDPVADMKAEAESMRVASMLDSSDYRLNVEYVDKKSSRRRTINADSNELSECFQEMPGDERASRKSRKEASVFGKNPLDVEDIGGIRQVQAKGKADMMPSPFDIPEMKSLGRKGSRVAEKESNEIQSSFNTLIREASRLMARGEMNTVSAGKIYEKIDEYVNLGARVSKKASRIASQVSALAGYLEL